MCVHVCVCTVGRSPLPSGVASVVLAVRLCAVQAVVYALPPNTSQHWKLPPRNVSSGSSVSVRGSGLGLGRDSFAHATMQNCDDRMLVHWKFIRIEVVSFCRADCYVERRVVVLDRRRCFGLIDRRYWRPCQAGCCNGECTGGLA